MRLAQYFSKSRLEDTYKQLQEFIFRVQYTFQTQVLPKIRPWLRFKTWFGWTTVFISIHILDQMIQMLFLTLFGSLWLRVLVAIFFLTISLWSLAALEARTT